MDDRVAVCIAEHIPTPHMCIKLSENYFFRTLCYVRKMSLQQMEHILESHIKA